MSWDIFVQDLPATARRIDDIPDDFVPQPIGRRAVIIATIREIVPSANFSDPAWGVIEGADYVIEVNLGTEELVTSFTFHVRGSDLAATIIAAILQQLNLRAFDSSTGDLFDPSGAVESLQRWRAYRNQVIRSE